MRNLIARCAFGCLLIFFLSVSSAHAQALPFIYNWLGKSVTYTPGAVGDAGDGSVTAFMIERDTDRLFYRRLQNNTWGDWVGLGGELRSAPSAASRFPGQMAVFVRTTSHTVGFRTWLGNANWSDWDTLGGEISSEGPRAISLNDGRMAVFIAGTAGHTQYRLFDGATWGGWEDLGTPLASCTIVRPVSQGTGQMTVFARCGGALHYRAWQGGSTWTPWQTIDTNITTFEVASWGSGRLDVVANEFSSSPRRIKWFWFDGSWHSQYLPDHARSVGIASPAPGIIDFFYQNDFEQDMHVYHRRYDNGQWPYAGSLQKDANGTPAAIAARGVTHVFVRGLAGDYNLLAFQTEQVGTVQYSNASVSVAENAGSVTMTISRSDPSGAYPPATVQCATTPLNATAGEDYVHIQQTVSWGAGDSSNKSCTVPIIDNSAYEVNEVVELWLLNPTGTRLGSAWRGTITIVDNDPPPPVVPGQPQWTQVGHCIPSCESYFFWDAAGSPFQFFWAASTANTQWFEFYLIGPANPNGYSWATTATSYTDSLPADGTTYYKVRACNSGGCSEWSSTVEVSCVTP